MKQNDNFENLLNEKIDNIDRQITENSQQMKEMMEQHLKNLDLKIDAIDTKLDSKFETRLNNIDQTIDKVFDTKVEGIGKSLDTKVEGLKEVFIEQDKSLDMQVNDIKKINNDIKDEIKHQQIESMIIFGIFLIISIAIFIEIFFI